MLFRSGFGGQFSGSVGGVTASRNAGGQYLRNRTVPVNPNTVRQQNVRQALSAGALVWGGLTEEQRGAWAGYAAETPVVNRLGETIHLSGFGMFVRSYAFFAGLGVAPVLDAPMPPGLSSLGIVTDVVVRETGNVTVTATDPVADGPMYVGIGPALSSGVLGVRGPWSLYAFSANYAGTGTGIPVGGPYRYGPPLTGERRSVKVCAADDEGRLTPQFMTIVEVVAGP